MEQIRGHSFMTSAYLGERGVNQIMTFAVSEEGGQLMSDILITHADRGGGKRIFWVREKMK